MSWFHLLTLIKKTDENESQEQNLGHNYKSKNEKKHSTPQASFHLFKGKDIPHQGCECSHSLLIRFCTYLSILLVSLVRHIRHTFQC